jgi:Lon protease-like protein
MATKSDESSELPIFPLAQVVMFPGVRVPLFIFEPRYRDMVRDALAGDGRIGMIAVRPDGVADMAGDPPIFEIGCEGRIIQHERQPDGTYNILLEGLHRYRIRRELPQSSDRLYRVAEVERLEDQHAKADEASVRELRDSTLAIMRELVIRVNGEVAASHPPASFDDVDDESVVNALSNALGLSPMEKQGLLQANSVHDRFAALRDLLEFRLLELAAAPGSNDGVVH